MTTETKGSNSTETEAPKRGRGRAASKNVVQIDITDLDSARAFVAQHNQLVRNNPAGKMFNNEGFISPITSLSPATLTRLVLSGINALAVAGAAPALATVGQYIKVSQEDAKIAQTVESIRGMVELFPDDLEKLVSKAASTLGIDPARLMAAARNAGLVPAAPAKGKGK